MSNLRVTIDDTELASLAHNKGAMSETILEESFESAVKTDAAGTKSGGKPSDPRHTTHAALGTVASGGNVHSLHLPLFANKDVYSKIPDLSIDGRVSGRRYAIGELLGTGGNGSVYDLRDNNFDRNVAVKMLTDEHTENLRVLRKFVHEALITAQLDHPNILPVYDMDVTEDGSLFYTMKKVAGYSLAQLIEEDVEQSQEIQSMDDLVRVFIKVCEAVSYAHARGIIHQDIKPSNIMLGGYGEVRIVDWGTAVDTKIEEPEKGRLVGTPMYMAPEQARREGADERSDVYCLGASLFHALTGHFPVWHESQRIFWQYKKEGIIDPLTPEDEANIPKPLIAITFKCLDPEATDRYQTVKALADDLKKYQAGQSVGAYHYSLFEFLKQWAGQHREAVGGGIFVVLLLIIGAFAAYNEIQKERSGWGKPIIAETFENDEDWRKDWILHRGSFAVEDGQLVTKVGPAFYAFYNKRIYGSVAIEFDGQMLPDSPPCDLSVAYVSDFLKISGRESEELVDAYLLQNGGYHNLCSMILGPEGRLDYENIQLENSRTYKIRAEVDRDTMRLFLDGVEVCNYRSEFPWTSGYIGIYGYFHSKAFDNIRIYTKSVAEKVSIIETADVFYTKELYTEAMEQYRKISESHAFSPLAEEAIYKRGLCYQKLGDTEAALAIWNTLTTKQFDGSIRIHHWDNLRIQQKYGEIIEQMEQCYESLGSAAQSQVHTQWIRAMNGQMTENKLKQLPRYVSFWERYMINDPVTTFEITRAFLVLGKYDLIPKYLSHNVQSMIAYYDARGEFHKIIDDYPSMRHQRLGALLHTGDFERVLVEFKDMRAHCADALIYTGRIDEALKQYSDVESVVARCLLYKGAYEEVIRRFPNYGWGELMAYLMMHRFDDFYKTKKPREMAREDYMAQTTIGLIKYIAGETTAAFLVLEKTRDNVMTYDPHWSTHTFEMFFQNELLTFYSGDKAPLNAALAAHKQRTYEMRQTLSFAARLVAGEISQSEFMAQPDKFMLKARFNFYQAIGLDVAGKGEEAAVYYQHYIDMPPYERQVNLAMPLFAQWRVTELAKAKP